MPEISLLHIGAATAAAIVGIVLGWSSRGSRGAREKSAINAGWQEQLEAKNIESERLQTQNKNLMEQVSRFQNADRNAGKQVKKLSKALEDAAERRTKLERQVDGLRSQLERAIADVNQLTADLDARPSVEETEATIARHKAKIAELNSALKQWQSRVPALVEKFRERDKEADVLAAELAEARQAIEELRSAPAASQEDAAGEVEADGETSSDEKESEGNVVSISFADRKRPSAVADEADGAGDEGSAGDEEGSADDDSDIVDAGINLDQEIAEAAAESSEQDQDDGEYTVEGTSLDEDALFTGSFAAATDDDTGQSRFEGSRTLFDPDSVLAPEDEADLPAADDARADADSAADSTSARAEADIGDEADDDTIEGQLGGQVDDDRARPEDSGAGIETPAGNHDDSGDEGVAAALDRGAYEDYPDDDVEGGLRDNLKRINGIGPAIEKTLNELGIFRYRQIADMTDYDIDRVERRLEGFRSRIEREDWIGQARRLLDETTGETA